VGLHLQTSENHRKMVVNHSKTMGNW
jgi:hypothetical protein